ncbi:MAG: hypothetical protein HOB79_11085 [Rhodospirillaceae bacterium]|jgi:uncharacterized protein HemX|nr:hypothetical protein [Rhodospirillales bacterium]MBT3904716.1 hypothetical protein [Rhodospirillaceae bacterium]MBT4701602.1 hypothetical protein [Rhodospirillaceae bacterium]MBT5036250.1 hypothetical protein [Rhodospirillaceae bacterium]MBT6221616.1 hypothetical protein [Rhodospirillaceae bacterium]
MLSVTLLFACAGLAVGLTAIWMVADSSQKVRHETQEFVEGHAVKTTHSLDSTNLKIKNLAIKIAKLEDRLLNLAHIPDNAGKQLTTLNKDVATLKSQLKELEHIKGRPPGVRKPKRHPHQLSS